MMAGTGMALVLFQSQNRSFSPANTTRNDYCAKLQLSVCMSTVNTMAHMSITVRALNALIW